MKGYDLKLFLKRAGLIDALDRFGLGKPLRVAWSFVSPQGREYRRLVAEDLKTCQKQIRRIAAEAPSGDSSRKAWMISSLGMIADFKLSGVISLAMRLAGYQPVVVGYPNPIRQKYHALFGLDHGIDFQKRLAKEPVHPLPPEFEALSSSKVGIPHLMSLTYHDVAVGRIALSNVLCKRKFERLDLISPELQKDIFESLQYSLRVVHAAEQLVEEQRPEIALVCEKGITPWAELVGVCWKKGVPVIQYSGTQKMSDFSLRRFTIENRFQHPFSLDAETWKRVKGMVWTEEQSEEVIREFAEAYKSGTWFNRKFLQQDKRIKQSQEVQAQLGLDPSKKTAVIFSHVLWDATFFYGEGLFDTYEDWLLETLRAACANPAVNWVVKLHPDLVWKLKYEGYSGELRDVLAMRSAVGTLPDHVKLVMPDTDISTYSFFDITDYCLTVRGTIGIEMACHAVPVITAGSGRYSHLGFTVDSASAKEYLAVLSHIQKLPPMSPDQVELARRFAYVLFNLRPWPLRSFEFVKMPIQKTGHPLDHNVVPRIESWKEFAQAEDVQSFVRWVKSGKADYLKVEVD